MNKLLETSEAKKLLHMIEESNRVVLTCHVRPDGDAIGSTLGLWHLLKNLGKEATVVVPDKAPNNLSFLPGFREIAVYTSHKEFCENTIAKADLIICCDFNTPSRQDSLAPLILNAHCRKVLIDHHMEPDNFTDLTISYPKMSSTCELVFRIIAAMGLYDVVDTQCATCLLTGIITDTRNFTVNCQYPDLYEILMRLLEKDVDKEKIIREALNTRSLNSLLLEAFSLSEKMEVFPEHKCSLITLSSDELKKYNYERGDTEGLVNRPLEVREIVYSIFLREDPDCVKISARSKNNFPVSEICKVLYGGGGHLQAAGAEFHGSLNDCKKILLDNLKQFDKYLTKDNKTQN
ncbi:MAG: bifunctional oligoribonuclease/PAP phosphatase NrnA [Muribaculaceae bacterium]|nr:bifunctional oligoribonuclease/PAP phosphatase NrnA [Muribaculaceae bacterium]